MKICPKKLLIYFTVLGGFLFLFLCCCCCCFSQERVSLCSPECPETHSVNQADLELRNLPASASRVLGLKACAATPNVRVNF